MDWSITVDFDALEALRTQLNSTPEELGRAINSAISSASYHIMKAVKTAAKKNEMGWPQKRVYSRTGKQITVFLRYNPAVHGKCGLNPISRITPPWGDLIKAFFYRVDKAKMTGEVGIIPGWKRVGQKAADVAAKLEEGFIRAVDPGTRGYFAAIGFPLNPSTTQLVIPPRPLLGPVWEREQARVGQMINVVIADKLTNGFKHLKESPFR